MESVKKVVILGSKGMAGHVIYNYLKQKTSHKIIDIARSSDSISPKYNLDVTNFTELEVILENEKPNCIGVLNQDAENNPAKAILLNSYLPHFLAKIGASLSFKTIHISTDCVFNGKQGNYTEDSKKDGIGLYAQTKALGELTYDNNLTIRTSIIGPEIRQNGTGLFHWFMTQTGNINGYTKAYWTGITTIELAKAIVAAIDQDTRGLHHLVNNIKINKYELILLFKKVFETHNINIVKYAGYNVDKSLVKTNQNFNYVVPTYQTMIEEMKIWMLNNRNLYKHYKF